MMVWARLMVAAAGLMGMAGVATAAAGAHMAGGDLARTAAEFLLIHAAIVLGISMSVVAGLRPANLWLLAASMLASGTVLFSADLALIAFQGSRPVPLAAPVGGSLMILGWLLVTITSAFTARVPSMSTGP